jgi:hypothetical protein
MMMKLYMLETSIYGEWEEVMSASFDDAEAALADAVSIGIDTKYLRVTEVNDKKEQKNVSCPM